MFGTNYYGFHREIANEIDFLAFANIEFTRSFFPRKCCVSGQSLWMRKSYKGVRSYHPSLIETRWYNKDQYMMLQLRK